MAEEFEAVHARHDQVRNDDIGVKGTQPIQRFLPVGGDLRLKVTFGEHGSQSSPPSFLIIDDENPARNRWQLGHRPLF
jgi:hypothetical protein